MKLLDTKGGNTKVRKSMAMGDVRIASLSLEPTPVLCPHSDVAECFDKCIKKSGFAAIFKSVTTSRMAKTEWLQSDPIAFIAQLKKELHNFIKLCAKQGVKPVVRLNTFSDVKWELLLDMEGEFGAIFFYDYTKNAKRLHSDLPSNYKLMFSYSAAPRYQKHVASALESGVPMTVVFRGTFPTTFMGRRVIDGDVSDLDNVFSGQVIVGLRVKGDDAKRPDPTNQFIVDASNLIATA